MITSSSVPVDWNGAFVVRKSFSERFTVVGTSHNDVLGFYEVSVVFEKSPDKTYLFEIEDDKYSTDKKVLAAEILRQLQNGA